LVIALLLSILPDAHITSCHPYHPSCRLVKEDFSGRKPREDVHAKLLCLLPQPADELTEAYDVVAVVVLQNGGRINGRREAVV